MSHSRSFLFLVLAACVLPVAAQNAAAPQLTPPAERITDQAQVADHAAYEAQQLRLKAINAQGRPLADYHLSKAQCWVDVSFHEYTRNDRSRFPQEALDQSAALAAAMERGGPLPMDTPHVNGATPLRPDLWARLTGLRSHAGYRCAQQATACAEVELVHAANENQQQGWRHAKPYVQMAEDGLNRALAQAEACVPPPAPVVSAPPPPVAAPQPVTLRARVLFDFDRSERAHIRPESLAALRRFADELRQRGITVQSLALHGHADRLNGTGQAGYNRALSERRASTVRNLLAELGVVADAISSEAVGDTQPVQQCAGASASREALQECLLSNRRVDVVVQGLETARR